MMREKKKHLVLHNPVHDWVLPHTTLQNLAITIRPSCLDRCEPENAFLLIVVITWSVKPAFSNEKSACSAAKRLATFCTHVLPSLRSRHKWSSWWLLVLRIIFDDVIAVRLVFVIVYVQAFYSAHDLNILEWSSSRILRISKNSEFLFQSPSDADGLHFLSWNDQTYSFDTKFFYVRWWISWYND